MKNMHNIVLGKRDVVVAKVAKNWRNTSAISRKICPGSIAKLANANRRG
jgi:hypothetical protein